VWWRAWTDRVAAFGVPLTWDDVEREIGPDRIAATGDYLALVLRYAEGDPRFDRYADDSGLLVAELCRPGQPLHVPHPWLPELPTVIGWIVAAGGVPVLAHPSESLTDADVALLRDAGLAGLEVWTTWNAPERSARLAECCARTGLIATAGSDYHGERVKAWTRQPGLLPAVPEDPLSIVDALWQWRVARTGTDAVP
jgi:predicted metal-dependent phosphoesterase TrpH